MIENLIRGGKGKKMGKAKIGKEGDQNDYLL
jgi:hypothetical protein